MKVKQLMTNTVKSCRAEDNLSTAARLMWDGDCGALPVVDANSNVIGMITDRDICMAAFSQGRRLDEISVEPVMAKNVHTVGMDDPISLAEEKMQLSQIRRLPVIDGDQKLVGIITLNDLAREAERERSAKSKQIEAEDIALTLAAVARPRNGHVGPNSVRF